MKALFWWHSAAFEGYAPGDIIVMADNVEAARKIAHASGVERILDDWGLRIEGEACPMSRNSAARAGTEEWLQKGYLISVNELEFFNRDLGKLASDLAREPQTVEPSRAIIIDGSR